MQAYIDDKSQLIFHQFRKANYSHCAWEVFILGLIEPDSIRLQQSEIIMLILIQPSFKLYGLSSVVETMIKLYKAYFEEYRYPQFRTSLDYMFFEYFMPMLNEVLAKGFSPEMIAFRPYLEKVILP